MTSAAEWVEKLGEKASPRPWDWRQIFPAPWPQNKDDLRYAAQAVNHYGMLVKALEKRQDADIHFARCSYELGGCETPTEDNEPPIFCKEYDRLEQLGIAKCTEALAIVARDAQKALKA